MRTLILVVLTLLMIGCKRQDSSGEATKATGRSDQPPSSSRQGSTGKSFDYSGVSPKDALNRAAFAAQQWSAKASLQAVLANKWELYGDPQNRKVSGMEVLEWRFVFVSDDRDRIGSFVVTRDAARLVKDEAKPHSHPSESPLGGPRLADWEVDAREALDAAYQAGVGISEGPWLWMRTVAGRPEPVWTILTLGGSVFVSAKTGRQIPKDNVK